MDIKFKKGKWYYHGDSYYLRCCKDSDADKLHYDEFYNRARRDVTKAGLNSTVTLAEGEVHQDVLNKYLPEGHPDKGGKQFNYNLYEK